MMAGEVLQKQHVALVGMDMSYYDGTPYRNTQYYDVAVKIFGEEYKLKAEVATINGLSSHAGQDLLIEYATGVKKSAQNIFLVQGEERGALPLMEKLRENRVKHVHYPAMRTVVDL